MRKFLLFVGMVFLSLYSINSYAQICDGSLTVTIEGSTTSSALSASGLSENSPCNGASGTLDGTIDLTVSGGSPWMASGSAVYEYLWQPNGETTEDLSGLGAGIYSVIVTDSVGCTTAATFEILEPTPVEVEGTETQLICHSESGDPTGAIDISASGGTVAGDYQYSWSTVGGSGLVDGVADQTGLSAGEYTVVATDDNGCSDSETWLLTEPAEVLLSGVKTDLDCHIANGIATGAINVSVEGGQGSVEGDYTYTWTSTDGFGLVDGQADQSGLTAGTYTLVVGDTNGCTDTETWTLTQPTIISIDSDDQNLSCHANSGDPNGEIDITVAGGQGTVESDYQYTWTTTNGSGLVDGQADQTGLSAGNYYLTVEDSNGCTQTAEFELTQPTEVEVDGETTPLLCHADSGDPTGEIDITVIGGQGSLEGDYDYNWTTVGGSGLVDGQADQTGLSAGEYTVVVVDVNGCTDSATFVLDEPSAVECSLDSPIVGLGGHNILCEGETGTIEVTATGGTAPYTYSLDGGPAQSDPNFEVLAGTYTVTVIDANGCESTCDITLTEPEALAAGTCVTDDTCQVNVGEIEVCAEGGVAPYVVTWESTASLDQTELTITSDGGCVTFTGAEGGQTYIFTVRDANGCEIGG